MDTPPKKNSGIIRIYKAFFFSMQGLRAAFQSEAAIRQEVALAVVMIPLSFWLSGSTVERILLICSVLLVILVELINSALEAIVDRIGTERHELSGKAKDIGSAAVFVAMMITVVIWGSIIFEQFMA